MDPWRQAGRTSRGHRLVRSGLLLLGLIWGGRGLWALDPARTLDACTHRTWNAANGLLQDSATALLESRDGFLWIGTNQGLVRFDGATFTPYSRLNTPAFTSQEVRCLADTPDGSIWIGTSQPGLFRLREGVFTRFGRAEGLPDEPILHLLRDREGGLWAAPQRGPLLHLAEGRFQPVPSEAGSWEIRGLALGAGGSLWVAGADSGLWRMQDGKLVLAALARSEITALEATPNGQVWVGTRSAGVLSLHEGRLEAPAWARELPVAPVTALFTDREGSLWIGLDGVGLFRHTTEGRLERLPWSGGGWTPETLLEDSSGALWVASRSAGLHLLGTPAFQPLPTEAPTRMVCQDAEGDVWCLKADHRLAHWSHGHPAPTPSLPDARFRITAIWPRREGGLWLGSEAGELAVLEAGRLHPFPAPDAAQPDAIRTLYEDPAGHLWVAFAHRGLLRLGPGGSQHFPVAQDLTALAGGGAGPLYLASRSRGLGLLIQDQLTWIAPPNAPDGPGVLSLLPDSSGGVWVGTQAGLRRFQDGAFQPLALPPALQVPVSALLQDGDHHLWLATEQGVLRVAIQALLSGGPALPGVITYDARDGLPSREPGRGPQPTAWRTEAGDLLFTTGRGLALRDARLRPPAPTRFRPQVASILVDDRPAALGGLLRIPPGPHRLEIAYTAACPSASDRIRFRYKLEGFDRTWNEAGERRLAIYANLPPGTYRFRLQAWSLLDDAPPIEVGQNLLLQPFFHQRPAFWILCGLGLLGFAFWLHRLRLQQLEARSAVLAERNRMAREIHDHLAQGFTGVLLQMEAAEAHLGRLQGDPGPVLTRLEHARRLATDSLQEARRSVMALRPRKPEGSDLLGALRALADRLLAGTGIQVAFRLEGRPRPLRDALEEELIRMAQELMTNALRHGRARNLEVVLTYEARRVRLRIQDDGQGFDPGAKAGGYGMRSIRESLRPLKGRLEVASRPGDGACVTIILPLRRWRP
ncbi:MAG TPA: two-component regulator propeller domain-containing protein [Holophagaceae bacterium]